VPNKYTAGDYFFQFVTITAGVLIALLINGLVQWNDDRALVEAARETIRREVATNLKELEGLPSAIKSSNADLENALNLANDLLSKGKTEIRSIQLNFNLPTLNDSGFRSAERTGALAHMDYSEVQRYSELYDKQELFDTHQRKAIDMVATGSALIAPSFDPTTARSQDVELFRREIMQLQAHIMVTQQLGQQLADTYRELLANKSN
jgi:hypothetical protein